MISLPNVHYAVILNDFKCVKPIITAIEHEVQSLP